ncbi:TOBE domain-containing protein [Pseudooctadecabacter sp.]|uniref:TOBE domain-containing protein n=1 Tax=Pseudooctadecabacter sp. TaxID=1966338 RepID=UPI0035C83FAC
MVTHGGYIQQHGTPAELFKKPANKFVAGFLGMPPMNVLNAELNDKGGTLYVEGKGFSIALPVERAATLKTTGHSCVTLGVRPSDLECAPDAPDDHSLDLNVIVSEYIGAQSVLICNCGDGKITVELKSETPIALGAVLRFAFQPENIHLFDKTTEKAL